MPNRMKAIPDDSFNIQNKEGLLATWFVSHKEGCVTTRDYYHAALIKQTTKLCFVNVYEVTREYGGPEEGGWWYNWYECLEIFPVREENAEQVKEFLLKGYSFIKEGDIYSVRGGTDLAVYIEDKPAESESRKRPHYE